MKKITALLLISIFCFSFTEAQKQKPLARLIADQIALKATFKNYALFTLGQPPAVMQRILRDTFPGAIILDLNHEIALRVLQEKPTTISLKIPTPDGILEISLVKVVLFANGFSIRTNKNESVSGIIEKSVHYQGIVVGLDESIAAVSIFNNEVIGMVSTKNGNYVIGKLKGQQNGLKHILYNDQKMNVRPKWICATTDGPTNYSKEVLEADYNGLPPVRCLKIYVESAFNVYQGNGNSMNNTANFLTGVFNQSAALYFNDGIYITLSQLFIWTSASPYDGCASSGACLSTFQSTRTSFNGDLGHLVSLSNGNGGLAAGFSGLCNSDKRQSECYSGLSNTFSIVPTYSWSVMVFTHEMGHLMGSRHTHACVWNSNNTAIDGCSGFTEGGCLLPGNPAGGGTLMSYCHLQSVGINFSLGFGPQPGNVIRNNINTAPCIVTCGNEADLYIKDLPTDAGIEPNPEPSGVFWASEDIWVRNTNDGFTNQAHQNPEYRTPVSLQPNYVYVRIRNRGFATSAGTEILKLYWAKASSALSWPGPWDGSVTSPCDPTKLMGGQMIPIGGKNIGTIAAGNEQIFEFEWYPQNPIDYSCFGTDQHHFCLLARIESSPFTPFGMASAETTDLWSNVKNNNNIAWKNVSVVDLIAGLPNPSTAFFMAGAKFSGRPMKRSNLVFSIAKNPELISIFKIADVLIDLGKLQSRWLKNGAQGEGFIVVKKDKKVYLQLSSEKANIKGIAIEPGEIQAIHVVFKTKVKSIDGLKAIFNLMQTDENNKIIGGESFKVQTR